MIDFKKLLSFENAFCGNLFYKIDNPFNARRLAIPDIHGCFNTFNELLSKVKIEKEDYLFLLGDYIDRGSRSKEVLDKIIELIKNDYRVFPLRGNHENMLLEKHLKDYCDEELKLPGQFRNKDLIDENSKIKKDYLGFISNLPYFYELDDYYLVHAGFNFEEEDFLNDYHSMIWINEFESKKINKRIIVGHKTRSMIEIEMQIANNNKILNLDNGCVYKSNQNLGSLVCFDLDTYELFIQKNID